MRSACDVGRDPRRVVADAEEQPLGEVERFPDLGRVWYESGPGRVDRALAQQFARLAERGKLRAPDPALAAQHFGHLVAGPPQTLLLFRARDALSEQEIDRFIDGGVAAFLAAYGAPPRVTREH